jgi:hypothetical protein
MFFYFVSMTLYEFNMLDEMEQVEAVWAAVCIDGRDDGEHKILLYQIDAFYVEVYYHKEHNVIKRFRSFASTEQLEPYLNKIDVAKKLRG